MKALTKLIIILLTISTPLFAGGNKETNIESENSMMMMVQDSPSQNENSEVFIEYQNLEQSKMIAAEAPTVLFFYASWCPTCRNAREDFIKRSNDLKSLNLIIVDYDNSTDLQKRYGVTYQHTFVQIDEKGDALSKWNGGSTNKLLNNVIMEDGS